MRQIDATNTLEILKNVDEQMSRGEVLQIYPFPFLARNDWFLRAMKVYNNYVLECVLVELARFTTTTA